MLYITTQTIPNILEKKTTVLFFFLNSFSSLDLLSLVSHLSYITILLLAQHALGYTKSEKHLTRTKQQKKSPHTCINFSIKVSRTSFPPPPFLSLMYSSPLHSKKYILNLLKCIYRSNDFCCFYHRTLQDQWCSLCVVKGFLTISSEVLSISMDRDSTTYLGNLFQGLTTLTVKKEFIIH